jgi:hypothetical protein
MRGLEAKHDMVSRYSGFDHLLGDSDVCTVSLKPNHIADQVNVNIDGVNPTVAVPSHLAN